MQNYTFLYNDTKLDKNKLKEDWIKKNVPSLYKDVISFSNMINFEYSKFSQLLYHYKINKTELPICDYCKKENKRFIGFDYGYKLGCSRHCAILLTRPKSNETRRLNTLEKYGVEHTTQLNSVKEKIKKTNIKKYGVEHASQNENIKNSIKKTNNIRYGTDLPLQNLQIKNKMIDNFIEKYGVSNPILLDSVKNKIKKNNLKKYGCEWHISSDIIKQKIKNSQYLHNYKNIVSNYGKIDGLNIISYENNIVKFYCEKCNNEFESNYVHLYNRHIRDKSNICTICNPLNNKTSNGQKEIINFLKELRINITVNDRKIINPYEIDIYLKDYNLGIEFNGIYWHSEINKDNGYHYDKYNRCTQKGIGLIQIWEDDWTYKKDIIKSVIKSRINKNSSIGARLCIIKVVSNEDSKIFLNENHIQGWCISKYRYGLYFENNLVSILTISNSRKNITKNAKIGEYEIVRFCNKIGTNIIGSLSKLWKFFVNEINPVRVISYCDNDLFSGKSYYKIGMKLDSMSFNYWWCDGDKRQNRWNFRKDKLISEGYDREKTESEIMIERGWYKCYGSGNKKFIWE